ncbi:Ldh family oxidoreductase [Aidingimonas lacisalsi]|uniref:Ldh family oxidoreductase n=1 Tax=Aidingimonas lacisalsi TaxID=2604086 RepID=UPI0011D2458A|nr:Ldh family oxidoreductase [Aidingimonas lacisalsi]
MQTTYNASRMQEFGHDILRHAGLDDEKASTVAEILVEADLMGHTTHGLQLLGPYLAEIESGRMAKTGSPDIISERPAVANWDGRYLPGPWLIVEAMNDAMKKAETYGTGTITIHRSNHIACLAAYLKRATDRGMMVVIHSSDPAARSVAPHGGLEATHSPNPIAVGFPTTSDPVLLDISTSITTNGMVGRLHKQGERLPHPWLKDASGQVTTDPSVLFNEPKGSILPVGGIDHGHKGYALGLMVEAFTSGLAGHGRAQEPAQWGASVFVQLLDPEAFGGLPSFTSETAFLIESCRSNPVPTGESPVRIPGQRALALRQTHRQEGIPLPPGVADVLSEWASKLNVPFPDPC